ncbi:hypothetical protein I4U23_029320 [Adineta vaga]|nr:hypothetical protein I4U23_029320 [Adineta vaga]
MYDEDEYEGITDSKLLADDLLVDTNIQLPSVRKLCIRKWSEVDDHRTFQRLLRLFPNLIDLELYDEQNLFSELLQHTYEADFVKNVLTRIKQLKIEMDWDITALTHKEIDVLFPNAEKLIEDYQSLG